MRLYFFPALLPLAPLLPWLLTALGVLAAGVRSLRRRPALGWLATLLLISAGALALWQKSRLPSTQEGTRLTPTASLPKAQTPTGGDGSASVSKDVVREGRLTEAWFRLNNRHALSAAIADPDLLVIGTFEGDVQAVSTRTGELVWTLHKSEPVLSRGAALNEALFVGEGLHTATSASLTALALAGGRPLWQREFIGHVESAPEIDAQRQRLYVTSGPGGLWALDPRDGAVRWHARLGHVDSPPAIQDDSLWATAQPDEKITESLLHELDPETGKSRFALKLPGQPWGHPLLAGDTLLLTTGIGQVGPAAPTDRGWSHAFSIPSRRLLWSVKLETMPLLESVLLPKEGLVIHALKSGKLVALDLKDGHIVWKQDLGSPCLAPPTWIESKSLLLALPTDGKLALLDPRSGKLLQRVDAGANATAAPLYANGRVFVVGGESVTAFKLDEAQ